MHKSLRKLIIISLTAAMTIGQTVVAAAVGPGGPGPGTPQETPAATEDGDTSTPAGPGYSAGPGGGAATDQGGAETAGEVPAETTQDATAAQPASSSLFMVESLPDVQQRVASHYVSMTLLRSDPAWSETVYATNENGVTVSSPQGISSMALYSVGLPGDVLYRTYSSASGWSRWVMNGEHVPWEIGKIVEAIQIRLAGVANKTYDISYSCTLSDGSTCGWSYNGRTNGAMGTGAYITGVTLYLSRKGAYDSSGTTGLVSSATSYDGIQFGGGLPTYVSGTGEAYTGWAWDCNDRYYFVNNAAVTGWQYIDGYKYYFDESTGKLVTDLEPLIGAGGPFMIKINKQMNCATIYMPDGDNGYIIPFKSFLCSTGDDTPVGTFRVPEKFRWHLMIHDVYCQYLLRLGSGLHILLHSDIYSAPNPATLSPDTYNFMGIARSAGCIRFVSGDAKWMYDHCPVGTTIQVYNSSIPGPFERPCVEYLISTQQTWDPTDPEAVAMYGTLLGAN